MDNTPTERVNGRKKETNAVIQYFLCIRKTKKEILKKRKRDSV